tara:strand:- start:259 stop:510 length:252 start_codon:yes stop_codon:yes gene_type:complete
MIDEGLKIVETLGTVGALAAGCGWLLWKVIKHQQERTDKRIEELYQIIIKLIDKSNKIEDSIIELKSSTGAIVDFLKNGKTKK